TTKPDPDERVDETQKNEVRRFRREIIETFGQSVLEATLLGVSRPYLGRVLSGEKPITAGIFDGSGFRHADRSREDNQPRQAGRSGFRDQHLERRSVEDRRRTDMGLDFLRPGIEPHLLRFGQSVDLEPEAAAGRQSLVADSLGARCRYWRRQMGVSADAA